MPVVQVVLLGDDRGSLHLYSLATEKLLATKQVGSCRIAAVVACESACSSARSGISGGSKSSGSSSGGGSSRDGSCVQFAVLSEDSVGLWQLRQGFSHGIAPGGHRQGVLILQYCSSSSRPQVGPEQPTDLNRNGCSGCDDVLPFTAVGLTKGGVEILVAAVTVCS